MPQTSLSQLNNNPLTYLGFNENLNRISSDSISKAILSDVDNVNFSVDDVVVTVDGVNANIDAVDSNVTSSTAAVTTDVNANTNSETSDIKTRISKSPFKRYATNSTYSNAWITLFSYAGSGTIEYINAIASTYHPTSGNQRFVGIRIYLDGVLSYTNETSGSVSGNTYTAGGLIQYDTGENTNLFTASSLLFLLGVPFQTSILIQFYNYRTGGDDAGLVKTNKYTLIIRET